MRATLPSRKANRSQPRTSMRRPLGVVAMQVHSATPLSPHTQRVASSKRMSGRVLKTASTERRISAWPVKRSPHGSGPWEVSNTASGVKFSTMASTSWALKPAAIRSRVSRLAFSAASIGVAPFVAVGLCTRAARAALS